LTIEKIGFIFYLIPWKHGKSSVREVRIQSHEIYGSALTTLRTVMGLTAGEIKEWKSFFDEENE
jgi:hypothetical protein